MSRIAATIDGLQQFLLTKLSQTDHIAAASLTRLSTGRRIGAPSDNPSAFLQISSLESRISRLTDLRSNVAAAADIGADLQTTLDEVRTHLNTVRTALVEDEDNELTGAEKNTNQGNIDTAIQTIRSLARSSIGGRRFLDGSVNFSYAGKNPAQTTSVRAFALHSESQISGSVTTAATQSVVRYSGLAGLVNGGNATVTLSGRRGTTTVSVTNGESLTAVRNRINLDSHLTGITATVSGDNLDLTTVDFGDEATIDIEVNSGSFSTSSVATGADAVVLINGQAISSDDVDGNQATYRSQGVHVSVDFAAGFTGAFNAVTITKEDVAQFSLSTQSTDRIDLAISGVFPELLGGVSGTLASVESGGSVSGLGTNTSRAIRIVDEALDQLTLIQGQVDAFADIAVASSERLLSDLQTNAEDSLDALNSVDEAAESVLLARQETLHEHTLAALSLLQQQQSSMVSVLRMLAGLT